MQNDLSTPRKFNPRSQGLLCAKTGALALAALLASPLAMTDSARLELYVDRDTKQVFTEPGPNRDKLGDFTAVDQIASEGASPAGDKVIAGKNGLEVSNSDFSLRLGGRIHADASTHNNDQLERRSNGDPVEAVSGTDIRRARLSLKGTVYRDFNYIIEGDWAGDSVSMKDVFVSYQPTANAEFTVGNQKHAVSMEIQESSNDIMFNERSLLSALTTPYFDRAIGANIKLMDNHWSLQGGLYGDAISSSGDGADEGGGWGMRGTYAPLNEADRVVHLGASLAQRKANDNNNLANSKTPRFRYETTAMSDLYLSDTGTLAGFEEVSIGVVEFAAMKGPFSIQSEFGQTKIGRDNNPDLEFDAYYVQAGWTLTGESRRYKGSDGEFKGLKPQNRFDPKLGHWGAWELALRLDELNLDDKDIQGGSQQRLTLNLNWYLNDSLRMMLGFSRAFEVDNAPVVQPGGGEPDDINIIMLRTQLAL